MPSFPNLVVMGASAGGVEVLLRIVAGLPYDFPAAVCVVLHTAPTSGGILGHLLSRAGSIAVEPVKDRQKLKNGHVYVAPPDHHLLIRDSTIRLTRGPKENGFRPAVDPLFRTAAQEKGRQVIGVVLSGSLDDGTLGLADIKKAGGIAIVQDPDDAHFPSMPSSALRNVEVDHIARADEIPALLVRLVTEPLKEATPMKSANGSNGSPSDVAQQGTNALVTGELPGPPSGLTCPECGGAIWELAHGKRLQFRCHVGHAYTADGMIDEQSKALEAALWTALRALEESAALRRRVAQRLSAAPPTMVREYERRAREAEEKADIIRNVLVHPEDGAGKTRVTKKQQPRLKKITSRTKA
jgi:two-component system chemotaxis response regulator CheB